MTNVERDTRLCVYIYNQLYIYIDISGVLLVALPTLGFSTEIMKKS